MAMSTRTLFGTFLCIIVQTTNGHENIPSVPSISKLYNTTFYLADDNLELMCIANGYPTPRIRWQKDGFDIPSDNCTGLSVISTSTLLVEPLEDNEGSYQCRATNKYGTAVSDTIPVQKAYLQEGSNAALLSIRGTEGRYQMLPSGDFQSVPYFPAFWTVTDSEGASTQVIFDERIAMDYFGNLHILSLQKSDEAVGGTVYIRVIINPIVRKFLKIREFSLQVTNAVERPYPVVKIWSSETQSNGLKGGEQRFKCIFSGSPLPTIEWYKDDFKINTFPGRIYLADYGRELVLTNLAYTDKGIYTCRASNDNTTFVNSDFVLSVSSAPEWDVKPFDIVTPQGGVVRFLCKGSGIPTPRVDMFINGVPLSEAVNNSRRFVQKGMDSNSSYVKIQYRDLQYSDSQVIQCNVSNRYGHVFTNARLQVQDLTDGQTSP